MRDYEVSDEHTTSEDIQDIIENNFGNVKQKDTNIFIVEDPKYEILNRVVVKISKDHISLDIEEISVQKATNNDLLSQVEDVIKSKNDLLRLATGKTVEQRKKEMREDVINSDISVTDPTLET
jgi:hypothetical protein